MDMLPSNYTETKMAKEPKAVSTEKCESLRGAFVVEFSHIKDDLEENKADNKKIKEDLSYIRAKVDNGFGAEIKNTHKRISDLRDENVMSRKENMTKHEIIDTDIKGLRRLFIWLLVVGGLGSMAVVFDIITTHLKGG